MSGPIKQARPIIRYAMATILALVGVPLAALGTGQLAYRAAAPSRSVYTEPAPCSQCPPGIQLTSAEVQARQGSKLFIFSGNWPTRAADIPVDLRLVANQLELRFHPSPSGFALVGGSALGPGDVAVGLRQKVLLISVKDSLLSTPVTFQFGLWSGSAYSGRIPAAGSLAWNGAGELRLAQTVATASPSPSPSAAPVDVTSAARNCTAVASGSVPGILSPAKPAAGTAPEPRTQVLTRFVGVNFATLGIGDQVSAQAPFSVTAVLLVPAATAGTGTRAIDRMGSAQLWAYWDGVQLHKGLRTWDGSAWSMATDSLASQLTVDLRTAGIAFYWSGIQSGGKLGFLVAAGGGCAPLYLTPAGVPQVSLA